MSFKQGRENHLIIPIGMVIIDEKNKLVNTNQIDSSTLKANRFKRRCYRFWIRIKFTSPLQGDNTIHGSNSVDGFYDREEFNNTFPQRNLGKILCN
jgi:hypothetical protein